MERFLSKINKHSGVFGYDGKYITECWLWTAHTNKDGYGMFWVKDKNDNVGAHRFSYEFFIGAIEDGLTIDHLCRVRHCVNPEHLDPVTIGINILRGTGVAAVNAQKQYCHRGHILDDSNTYLQPNGRGCVQCRRIYQREYQKKLRRKNDIGFIKPRWSEEEKDVLNKLYFSTKRSLILKALNNKSWKAIQSKACLLGLKRLRGTRIKNI